MKIKKLLMTVLVLLSVQMCGPEPKLDYNVTKSESYKISEKGNIAKLQNEYELLKLVAQKLQYKDIQDMSSQMEKMDKKEAFSKFMNGISGVIEDEFKKEENYTEMTTTVNMNKVNNTWHIKNLDEQIKAIEMIFSNLSNSM